jgi:hypothetical protein
LFFCHWRNQPGLARTVAGGLLGAIVADLFIEGVEEFGAPTNRERRRTNEQAPRLAAVASEMGQERSP